jgi:hypothetical protein
MTFLDMMPLGQLSTIGGNSFQNRSFQKKNKFEAKVSSSQYLADVPKFPNVPLREKQNCAKKEIF